MQMRNTKMTWKLTALFTAIWVAVWLLFTYVVVLTPFHLWQLVTVPLLFVVLKKIIPPRNIKPNVFQKWSVVLVILVLYIVATWYSLLLPLSKQISSLITLVIAIIIVVVMYFQKNVVKRLLGEEDNGLKEHWMLRYTGTMSFGFILFIYVLLTESNSSQNLNLSQFSVMATAPTLGGLVYAAAQSAKKSIRRPLICVAQKMVVATFLFLVFVPCFFIADYGKNIDINKFGPNINGVFFWIAGFAAVGGVSLLALGVIDLILVLGGFTNRASNNPQARRNS